MDSDQGKLFIGGIAWETNEDKLNDYFSHYGEVRNIVIMRDKLTGRPRGFGFVVFADPSVLDRVLQDKHTIDGRTVEAKRALSREDQQSSGKSGNNSAARSAGGAGSNVRTKKIFVGGLPPTLTEDEFRQYFQSYGNVIDVVVMYDQNTQRPRGFGFVSFDSEDAVDNVLHQKTFHELSGKQVEVKRALPKDANPSSGGGRSMGGGGSYQSYGGSTGNASSYDGRMDGNRYTQQPQAGGNGYPTYGSSGYGAPGYGYGAPNSNVGYGGYGGYGNPSSGYSGPSGPYGNPNVPNAGYISAPPGSQRNPWGNQTPSGYNSAGYGGGSTGYGSASAWNAQVGSGGSGAAPTGQSPSGATGYGNQGYGYGGYGGPEGPYGSQGNYGSVAGRTSGGPANNPTEVAGDQGAGSGYVGGGYGDAWRSDASQGGPYGNSQVNTPAGGPVGYGGGYGAPQGRQPQQQ